MARERLNNFQKAETARWLLNISQAAAIGGVGSLFIPGLNDRIGLQGAIGSVAFAITFYLFAMFIGRKVKNVD